MCVYVCGGMAFKEKLRLMALMAARITFEFSKISSLFKYFFNGEGGGAEEEVGGDVDVTSVCGRLKKRRMSFFQNENRISFFSFFYFR